MVLTRQLIDKWREEMKAPERAVGRVTWCGPYALATVLGVTYQEAYRLALWNTGRTFIKGMANWHMCEILKRRRIKTRFQTLARYNRMAQPKGRVTVQRLTDWLKPNRLYIVNITDHYIVVDSSDWTAVDNKSEGGWWPIERHHSALCAVEMIAEIRKIA